MPLHDLLACRSGQPFVKVMLEFWSNLRDRSQLHLEHHVVQRFLGRFLAQGFIPGETPGIVEPDVEAPRAIESTEHQRSPARSSLLSIWSSGFNALILQPVDTHKSMILWIRRAEDTTPWGNDFDSREQNNIGRRSRSGGRRAKPACR